MLSVDTQNINALLQYPDYAKEWICRVFHEGKHTRDPLAELHEAMRNCWWVRAAETPAVLTELAESLGAPFTQLAGTDTEKKQADTSTEVLLNQFFAIVDEWKKMWPEVQSRMGVLAGNQTDEKIKNWYDLMALRFSGHPGYGSYNYGLTPARCAALMGLTETELTTKKIIIPGIGCGDFVSFSLPPHCTHLLGIDISPEMVARCNERGIPSIVGNVAVKGGLSLPEAYTQPDIIIADFFLDLIKNPADVIHYFSNLLPQNGVMMVTVLVPINQSDKKFDGTEKTFAGLPVAPDQDIGNTGNPWSDMKKLQTVCSRFGLHLTTASITSYVHYNIGKPSLYVEVIPSFIAVFRKR